jgi:ribosomal protein L37AE/L43A
MLTDLALILFPIHIVVTLQMSLAKKVTIMTFFGARSLYGLFLHFLVITTNRLQRHRCDRCADGLHRRILLF